jgi:long-subunit acyl-CoA synthetase (AMP-forming)
MGWTILSGWLRAPWVLAVARSIDTVLEDAATTRPTLPGAPPRLFEKAHAGLMPQGSAAPGLRGRLFRLAVRGAEDWGNPEATAAAIQDGWLRTGDVGELESDGCLRITDRKKDLLKTSGGKFVAPLQLESLLRADALIANAMAYGDGRRYVTALIALNQEGLERWAVASGLALGARPAEHPAVRARIQEAVDRVNAQLPRYATIKRFAIAPEDFDVASGTLTATLKVKRRQCAKRCQALLDGLYAG